MASVGKVFGTVLIGVVVAIGLPPSASAYCLTYTCTSDGDSPDCVEDNGCEVGGKPLHWSSRCISFSVQADGSPRRDIRLEDARRVIGGAFYTWTHAQCPDGANPAIEVFDLSPVSCRATEFDVEGGNANIWVFRDTFWPYDDTGTLALTTVTYNPASGEIFDADVEINTAENQVTVGSRYAEYDLASIATHEAGHVLGLSHSPNWSATMYAAYDVGSVTTRRLHLDDVHGICAAIPPDRDVPDTCDPYPKTGFSAVCDDSSGGCAIAAASPNSRGVGFTTLLLCGLVLRRCTGRRGRRARDV